MVAVKCTFEISYLGDCNWLMTLAVAVIAITLFTPIHSEESLNQCDGYQSRSHETKNSSDRFFICLDKNFLELYDH